MRVVRCAVTAACVLAFLVCVRVEAQETVVLHGRVIEAGAGNPVAGAEVRAATHSATALTAADGSWSLTVPAETYELVIEHLAFASTTIRVDEENRTDLTVRLTPRAVSINALVVTASRRLQQLKDVTVGTEVVSREELERSGASDVSAVLTERTGIVLEGGHPVGAGVMIQGLGSERVLVLMDGQPVIGRISGSLDLSRLPLAMIDRVEVVKGTQSTLYGSEAMGGVVNIITREPARGHREARLALTGGSNERLDATAGYRGSAGPFDWTMDGGRRSIELVPGQAGDAGTFATRWDGAGRVEWRAAPSLSVNAGGLMLDESQRWSSGALYHFADNVQWGARLGAVHTRGAGRLTSTLYATGFSHLSRRSTLSQPIAGGDDESEVQRLLEAELLYSRVLDRVTIDAGIEARRESIHSERVTGMDRVLHSAEPFAQATWSGESWSIVPGVRVSWSEQWGFHATPRIAALLRPAEQVALRASVGRGFRAPSFKELYMEFLNTSAGAGYRVQGNPDLHPESSTNLTGSVEWIGERTYARVQSFYNRFDDFIETREVPDDGELLLFAYANVDDGETYGAEVEIGATWGGLRAEAGYAWLKARDRASGQPLLGRPEHSTRATFAYALPFGLRASVSGMRTGAMAVSRTTTGELAMRDALVRLDARVAQELPFGLELSAGVDNILDAPVAGYPGYTRRQVHVGIGWTGARSQIETP